MNDVATKNEQPPVKFSKTKAAINKMAAKWKVVPDMTTKEGYAQGQQAKRELTPMRTAIEKEMKEQKKTAQEHIANINDKGNELIVMVKTIEAPIYDAKNIQDELVAKEKREVDEKEERRIADIEDLVEEIQNLTEGLLGANLETLETRLTEANKLTITNDVYMEFVEAASVALAHTKEQLTAAVKSAEALVAQQKELDVQQKEIDKQNQKTSIKEKIHEIKEMPIDAIGLPVVEVEAKLAELDIIEVDDSYGDLKEDAYTAITNTRAKLKSMIAHREDLDAQQQNLDDEKAQREADELAEQEKEALAARMPEDIKVRAFMDRLLAVEPPDVEDPHLLAVLRNVYLSLSNIDTMVCEHTQAQINFDGELLKTEAAVS